MIETIDKVVSTFEKTSAYSLLKIALVGWIVAWVLAIATLLR